jgi:hypothetical protein
VSCGASGRILYSTNKSSCALLYERFQVHVVDGGERLVEKIAGEWNDGYEIPVEEDCMKDC